MRITFSSTTVSPTFSRSPGYLNIAAALMNNDLVTLPALSPAVVRDPATNTQFGIARTFSIMWGVLITLGDSALFGNIVFARLAVNATPMTRYCRETPPLFGV